MVEFALAFPVFILTALLAFALIDVTATQAAVESGLRRAASELAGSNDDRRALSAANATWWLRGQPIAAVFTPSGESQRCAGTLVTIEVSARGHLFFLLPTDRRWSAHSTTTIEDEGDQRARCGH